jgi:AbrB family looped-hinge helix DNA binding protein
VNTLVKTSAKGEMVIPGEIRTKLGIKPDDMVLVTCVDDARVMIEPLLDDPIETACGSLSNGPPSRPFCRHRGCRRQRAKTPKCSQALTRLVARKHLINLVGRGVNLLV